jgi:hypothetical protein
MVTRLAILDTPDLSGEAFFSPKNEDSKEDDAEGSSSISRCPQSLV